MAFALPEGCCNPMGMFRRGPLPLKVWARTDLSSSAKLLYPMLLYHGGKNGVAWPYIKTLGAEIGLSPRNISRVSKELQKIGAIRVESRQSTGRPNKYYFVTDFTKKNSDIEEILDADAVQESAEGGRTSCQEGRTNSSPGYDESVTRVGRIRPLQNSKRTVNENYNETETEAEAGASASTPKTAENFCGEREGIFLQEQNSVFTDQLQIPLFTPHAGSPVWNWTGVTMPKDEAKTNLKERLGNLNNIQLGAVAKEKATRAAQITRQQERRHRGKISEGKPLPVRLVVPVKRLEALWVKCCNEKFPDVPMAQGWTYKEHKPIKALFEVYKYTEEAVAEAIVYFIRYWDKHRTRFSKVPASFPTVALFHAVHDRVIPEAKVMSSALKVKVEYEAWCKKQDGDFTSPPQDLLEAFQAAKKELETVGL